MTKLSALAAITSTDGTEDLYAIKKRSAKKINLDVICSRAAAFVPAPPETLFFYFTTPDDTPADLTTDGTGTFSGSNGLLLDDGTGYGIVAYDVQVAAFSASGEHLFSTSKNVASYQASGPTAALLGADTFTIVDDSAGASGWYVNTVVDPTTMFLYFIAVGAPAENVSWRVRLTPVRTGPV